MALHFTEWNPFLKLTIFLTFPELTEEQLILLVESVEKKIVNSQLALVRENSS